MIALTVCRTMAQVAPDIAHGTSAEDVIRIYGWPKGRSLTEDRQIWMYDGFQVLLREGRVLSVTPLPGRKVTPPAVRKPAPTVQMPVAAPRRMTEPVLGTTPAKSPVASVSHFPLQSAPPAPPPAPHRYWPLALIAGSLLLFTGLYWRRSRRRTERAATGFARPSTGVHTGAAAGTKRWEDSVNERLSRHFGSRSSGTFAAAAQNGPSVRECAATPGRSTAGVVESCSLSAELIESLEWKRFELLVCRYFRAIGFDAECTRSGADGGIDVVLQIGGANAGAVQCKAWSGAVGVKPIRELFGVITAAKIPTGYFVTTSTFTPDAHAWAVGKPLTLIDGDELLKRLRALDPGKVEALLAEVTEGDYTTPTCPRCDIKLVMRAPANGRSHFWGCTRYPRCDYKMRIRGERA